MNDFLYFKNFKHSWVWNFFQKKNGKNSQINSVLNQIQKTNLYQIKNIEEIRERFEACPKAANMLLYVTDSLKKIYNCGLNGKIDMFYDSGFDCIEITVPITHYQERMNQIDSEIFELNRQIREKYGTFAQHVFVAV
ncbi:hypothetical protein [Methanolapillus millepedarum]|uniref:Uncharacterized protein n=1 Tax=Methanolapillus millepedarum TaxID=3028296 RepID=A0AA96ZUB7_9EURY|nr:hypothetical protein MsAc7_11020 [Methanosarcinaceae archaeon Ac7]